ncbi:hypothetical protein Bca4012_026454 [Brassica carinata]
MSSSRVFIDKDLPLTVDYFSWEPRLKPLLCFPQIGTDRVTLHQMICSPFLTLDAHHEMENPQCLFDTICQTNNFKVKVSDYNFSEKRQTISITIHKDLTVDIEGEHLPGPSVTCNSAFGGTCYARSFAGGSSPTNNSEEE